jgi:pyruvate kinase
MVEEDDAPTLFSHAVANAKSADLVTDGDLVVITAGVPIATSGTTNMMRIHVVGDTV